MANRKQDNVNNNDKNTGKPKTGAPEDRKSSQRERDTRRALGIDS